MKGTCYGGPLYLPAHPDADMNGLVRCVIRTKSWIRCEEAIQYIYGDPASFKIRALLESNLWRVSESAVEQLVSATHYGEILVCPLAACYIAAEKYKRLEKQFYPRGQKTA